MNRTMGPLKSKELSGIPLPNSFKDIHLELVSDLTTEAFLTALKRFVTRRGRPIEIHGDNGRNFDGANNELRKILKALFKDKMEEIMDFCLKNKSNGTSTHLPHHIFCRGSRVVWVSDRGLPCHEFEPSTTKDPPCRAAMHVKSVES
ncbi:hypothetical protein TNCV_2875641 [Trichonephila clavipes]|nr:hypothetical protein TNCV_2875641 [Trichonephila clavipes]